MVFQLAKAQHQKELWKVSLAKAQNDMVEQTRRQNELLASQTDSMKSLAEDSQSMVEDSFMSKDVSQMDEQAKKYYQFKKKEFLAQYNLE